MDNIDAIEVEKRLRSLPEALRTRLCAVKTGGELEAAKAEFFGPNGSLTVLSKKIGGLPKSERPTVGQIINDVRAQLESALAAALSAIEEAELAAKLGPAIDPTLSCNYGSFGYRHPLSQVREHVVDIFHRMGFSVAEASEIETEWTCFDALNMPSTHAARDSMDTFFLPETISIAAMTRRDDERFLLRTHTTTVQVRELLKGNLPLQVIAPGRVFRRDTVDATHSANFHQCDVVHVDRNVSVADLKATIDFFLRELFGCGTQVRYRPSHFPFTEPSFEVDVRSPNLGKLSGTWIEILGCGIIHPNVFRAVNIDPEQWSGQAWGIGIERICMLLHGIDDVRHFYRNDMRFLRQFNGCLRSPDNATRSAQ
ncbi:MAG: phenylalanine--tRNA ligase subunit alpha [Puniceicoccales bacterium]|jgi:phenylalanyl-tRNA synthetase alpha chain|nr:phenylalanine--tRNA ligase subunit alpha [Puniceicoccales bacterium]